MIVQPFAEQGIQWDDRAVELAAQLCGRLPLYVIFLLQEIVHDLNSRPDKAYVRADDVNLAVERLLRSDGLFANLVDRWRGAPVEQACVRAVLRHGSRGTIDEDVWRRAAAREQGVQPGDFDAAANSLVAQGVVLRSGSSYRFAVPVFWRWLRRHLSSAARSRALGLEP